MELKLETYSPKEQSHEPIEAIRISEAFIRSCPHHTGEILQTSDETITLYTGKRIGGGKLESLSGSVGDYLVQFKDGSKTIIQRQLFEGFYKKEESAIVSPQLSPNNKPNSKEEKDGTISTAVGAAPIVSPVSDASGTTGSTESRTAQAGESGGADGSDSEKAVSGSAEQSSGSAPSSSDSPKPVESGHAQKGVESPNSGASDSKAANRKG